jgi:hypothetical protein
MSDIASLAFAIDSSQVQPAVQNLNDLNQAAQHVRASTQFLVSSFSSSSEALTQLATSGRASLGAFISISQNLTQVTQQMESFRAVVARTSHAVTGGGMLSGLTAMQRTFASMAAILDTTSAKLENFVRLSQQLGLNSTSTGAAGQRIFSALRDTGASGQAERQDLETLGVTFRRGMTAQDVLRQVQRIASRHPHSYEMQQLVQGGLGPVTPQELTRLSSEPYWTVGYRRRTQLADYYQAKAGPREEHTATENRRLDLAYAKFNDESSYFSPFVSNPFTAAQIALVRKLQPHGALSRESVYSIASQNQLMDYALQQKNGRLVHPRFFAQSDLSMRGSGLGFENSGPGRWLSFLGSSAYDANRNEIFMRTRREYEHEGLIARTFGGQYYNEARRLGENLFGFYKPLHLSKEDANKWDPLYAKDRATGETISQLFGDNRLTGGYNARQALIQLTHDKGTLVDRVSGAYGDEEGQARLAQAMATARYVAKNAQTPGFSTTQAIAPARFLAGVSSDQAGEAQALLEYARTRPELNSTLWGVGGAGGGPMSLKQALGTLTAGELHDFNRSRQGNAAGLVGQLAQSAQNAKEMQQHLASSMQYGSSAVAQATAGWQAYYEVLSRAGSKEQALAAKNSAMLAWAAQQKTAAGEATAALKEQTRETERLVKARDGLTRGSQLSYDEANFIAQTRNQVTQQLRANAALNRRTVSNSLFDNASGGAVADAQDRTQSLAMQAQTAQTLLSASSRRADLESHVANVMQVQREYAQDIARAQAAYTEHSTEANKKNLEYLQRQVQEAVRLRDLMTAQQFAQQNKQAATLTEAQARSEQAILDKYRSHPNQRRRAMEVFESSVKSNLSNPGAYKAGGFATLPAGTVMVIGGPGVPEGAAASGAEMLTMRVSPNAAAAQVPAGTGAAPASAHSWMIGRHGGFSAAARHAAAPYQGYLSKAGARYGIPASFLEWQMLRESSGNAQAGLGTAHVGPGQFDVPTAQRVGLIKNGHDYRTDPAKAIMAMAHYDHILAGGRNLAHPAVQDYVAGRYGSLPGATQTGHAVAAGELAQVQQVGSPVHLGYSSWGITRGLAKTLHMPGVADRSTYIPQRNKAVLDSGHVQGEAQAQSIYDRVAQQNKYRALAIQAFMHNNPAQAQLYSSIGMEMPTASQAPPAVRAATKASVVAQTQGFEAQGLGQAEFASRSEAMMAHSLMAGDLRGAGAPMLARARAQALQEQRQYSLVEGPRTLRRRTTEILGATVDQQSQQAYAVANQAATEARLQPFLLHAAAGGSGRLALAQAQAPYMRNMIAYQRILNSPNASAGDIAVAHQGISAAQLGMQATSAAQLQRELQGLTEALHQQTDQTKINSSALKHVGDTALRQRESAAATQADITLANQYPGLQGTPAGAAYKANQIKLADQGYQMQIAQQAQAPISGWGDAMGNMAQNIIFQRPTLSPGQGIYARQQLAGMFHGFAQDMFQSATTGVRNTVNNFFKSTLSSGVSDLAKWISGVGSSSGSSSDPAPSAMGGMGTPGVGAGGYNPSDPNNNGGSGGGITFSSGGTNGGTNQPGTMLGGFGNMVSGAVTNSLVGKGIGAAMGGIEAGMAGHATELGQLASSLFAALANGGAYNQGRTIAFASGSTFHGGSVVNTPTRVPMALMGESGPEAVLPLKRGPDGRLGVATSASKGMAGAITINSPITINAQSVDKGGNLDPKAQAQLQRQLNNMIALSIKSTMANEARPGGMLNPTGGTQF